MRCKTCVQCQNNVPLPPLEELQNLVFRFYGMEENPGFQIKCDTGRDKHGSFELPCGCRFLTPDEKGQYQGLFLELLASFYRPSQLRLERSLWRNDNFKKAEHLFCDKDPDQKKRLMNLLLQRRVKVDSSGLLEVDRTTKITAISATHLAESVFFCQQLTDIFSKPLPNTTKPKKGGPLPKTVKETLQEANKQTEEALTDEQLAELFNADSTDAQKKKKAKKTSKRKPNKGKAPNNIRKSKKPVKL